MKCLILTSSMLLYSILYFRENLYEMSCQESSNVINCCTLLGQSALELIWLKPRTFNLFHVVVAKYGTRTQYTQSCSPENVKETRLSLCSKRDNCKIIKGLVVYIASVGRAVCRQTINFIMPTVRIMEEKKRELNFQGDVVTL